MREPVLAIPRGDRAARPRPARRAGADARADRLLLTVVWAYLATTLVAETTGLVVAFALGSFDINVFDPSFFTALAVAGYALLRRAKHVTIALVLGAAIAGLIGINLLRGMVTDMPASLIWLRANGFFALGVVLAMTARPNPATERQVTRAFTIVALALSLLVVLRLMFGAGLLSLEPAMVIGNEGRPIGVHGTMMMDVAVMLLLSDAMRARWRVQRGRIVALGAVIVGVVLTAQGTATLCMIVGVALLLLFENGPRIAPRAIGLGFAGLLLLIVTLIPPELYLSSDIQQRLADRGRNREFRQFIWRGFTDYMQGQDALVQIVGHPADIRPSFTIYPPGAEQVWDKSIHSMYYGQIAIAGYVGLLIYVAMLVLMLATFGYAILRRQQPLVFSAAVGLGLTVQAAMLGYSYEVRNEEVLLLLLAWMIGRSLPSFASRRVIRPRPPQRVSQAGAPAS